MIAKNVKCKKCKKVTYFSHFHKFWSLRFKNIHILGVCFETGKGAWNTWSYDIMLLGANQEQKQVISNVWNTSITLSNLDPNTIYNVKVRAKSETGEGPWSGMFKGRTLTEGLSTDSHRSVGWCHTS